MASSKELFAETARAKRRDKLGLAVREQIESLEGRRLYSCVIDVRLASGGKSLDLTSATASTPIDLQVWAVVTGTDASGANDGFQSVAGSFLSTSTSSGSILGNMTSTVLSPFTANGYQNGEQADLDGDGDLDIGSNDFNDFTPYFYARSAGVDSSGGVLGPSSQSFEIGTIVFDVTNLKSGQATDINFRERGDDSFTGGALWSEDGNFTDSNTGSFSVGAPVVITDTALQTAPTESISGEVYHDTNSNGKLDSGETGAGGVVVYIDSNNSGALTGTDPQTTTAADGTYSFTGLAAGSYVVRQVVPTGDTQTAPASNAGQHVTLSSGVNASGINFGDAAAVVQTESISGEVYNDANNNGTLDSGETGLGGVEVYIDTNNTGAYVSGDPQTTTANNGTFSFTGLAAGMYVVRQVVPSGDTQTAPASGAAQDVTLTSGNNATGINFGDAAVAVKTESISGEVYNDANSNGKLDSGETGLGGVVVYIDSKNSGALTSSDPQTTTAADGTYSFSGLTAGAYIVREVLPGGDTQTAPSGGMGQHATLTSGTNATGINFGDAVPVVVTTGQSISGEVYDDANSNGKLDSGEAGIANVTVYIDSNNDGKFESGEPITTTSSAGTYSFTGLTAGAYIVRQVVPTGDNQTAPSGGLGQHITLTAGTNATAVNFGDAVPVVVATGQSISGEIYDDANSNGKLDSGEVGIANVTVYIDSNNDGKFESGEPITTTSSAGTYSFSGLTAGAYIVRQVVPSGDKQTAPGAGLGQHVTIVKGTNLSGINFGDAAPVVTAGGSITGEVYKDTNGNGKLDSGETGMASVFVWLDLDNSGAYKLSDPSTTTNASGVYSFTGLASGNYIVRQMVPTGYSQTDPTRKYGNHVTVTSSAGVTGANFGDVLETPAASVSITGEAYVDVNANGKLDSGETPLANVVVYIDLYNIGTMKFYDPVTTTNAQGIYSFAGLAPGNYIVRQVVPSGYSQTDPTRKYGNHVVVASGKTVTAANFGDETIAATADDLFSNLPIELGF